MVHREKFIKSEMNVRTDIFEKLILKRDLKLTRTTVLLSDRSGENLKRLQEIHKIRLFEIVSSILSEYHQIDDETSGECLDGVLEEVERITNDRTRFPNRKTISLKEDDLRALRLISKERRISRDVLINAIINYAEFCIHRLMEERCKQMKKAREIVVEWLTEGEEISNRLANELGASDELVSGLLEFIEAEKEFLNDYNCNM
ncbi:MAG: hypothetical protein DRN08_05670 [Thermoplasmata archaeon]|nr:MAG: hypothetical protein DRN08_05670 [Thermoplasmata archaeon]